MHLLRLLRYSASLFHMLFSRCQQGIAMWLLRYSECILLVLVVWLSGCCYNAVKVFKVSFTHYCFMWLG